MSILDWAFIALLSCAILFFIFSLLSLVFAIQAKRKYTTLKRKKMKDKRKRKKLKKLISRTQKSTKKHFRRAAVLFLSVLIMVGAASYSRYYQQTTLEKEDANAIVQSYFLIDEVGKQLTGAENGASAESIEERIKEVSSLLVTYGNKKAYAGLAVDRQKTLNRYYTKIRELGANLSNIDKEKVSNIEYIQTYQKTVKQLQTTQKTIFKLFAVNEVALKQKK
ncbi:hypothetical protein BCR24_07485 [Enterococcus ureilyticus]|uniref:Uncharacterized protein n=1 Tax=Enterococcus ureilyticus TaxID=1131292 RepID=A0A1E5H8P2_9ENTE|nr:hypothetical protein [Enterococcus ureilyticus]MBM7687464.1 putative RND superfamily exporter protein [Enterococcus ureilyticus]OEG21301.1 hypothetical protein BCR24_07485 [Enterococcus ureilyticus]